MQPSLFSATAPLLSPASFTSFALNTLGEDDKRRVSIILKYDDYNHNLILGVIVHQVELIESDCESAARCWWECWALGTTSSPVVTSPGVLEQFSSGAAGRQQKVGPGTRAGRRVRGPLRSEAAPVGGLGRPFRLGAQFSRQCGDVGHPHPLQETQVWVCTHGVVALVAFSETQ